MKNRIVKNASALMLVQIINPLMGMAFVITLARINGAVGLGEYTFALSMAAIFEIIGGLGIREYLIREVGKCETNWRPLMTGALTIGSIAAILAQIAMLLAAKIIGYDAGTMTGLTIISFSMLPTVIYYVLNSFHYAFERMAVAGGITVIETLVRVALSIVVVLAGMGINWLLLVFVFSRLVAALTSWLLQVKYLGLPGRSWNPNILKSLLKAAPTFVFMAILAAIYWRVDILMLSKMIGAESVGQYSAGYRLMYLISFVGTSLLTATYPALSRTYHHFRQDFNLMIDKGIQYVVMIYLPVSVAVDEMSPKIIELFFGDEFAAAATGLRILIWTTLPYTVASLFARALVAAGRQKMDLRVNAYRLGWNVVLNYLLISWMGMIGACLATLISCIASVGLQVYYLKDTIKPNVQVSQLLKTGAATAVLFLVLKLTAAWMVLVQALVAAVIYVAVLLLLKPFDLKDRKLLECLSQKPVGETA